tara:strand:+ start:13729 stop:15000 length:1272 start_codon:yes stop_codon:yes gene_type:complete
MRQAVTAVLTCKNKVFAIKRQNHLSVFPGYTSFPGGKLDKGETIAQALAREVEEELGVTLESLKPSQTYYLGVATTPPFNPYRFETHFYRYELDREAVFTVDVGEVEVGEWVDANELLNRYQRAELMAVPPTISLIKALAGGLATTELELDLVYDPETEVPLIESIAGVRQLLPLSNTFPPANRTNSFILGDEEKILVDPSPKDEKELARYLKVAEAVGFDKIFLTHHHPDHHEFAPEIARVRGLPILMSADSHQRILVKWGPDYFRDCRIQYVHEGDVVCRSQGVDVIAFNVPGHDEGQIALAPKTFNWILVSDLIQTIGTVTVGGPEGDMAKYFASLEKVIARNPKFVIPSHGIAVGGTYKLQKTLDHRRHREAQIAKLLKSNKSLDEIVAIVYEGLEQSLVVYARYTVEAHIAKIRNENL